LEERTVPGYCMAIRFPFPSPLFPQGGHSIANHTLTLESAF
jgi:hypothetical protein